jgi:BirA family biotin operon repressor/biotin-[acetyl-CoA-carboxylase] ligase
VLLTRDQRSGRGRLDRSFVTPRGTALAISVLVRMPDVPLAARGWIPLIAGVAMREAVAAQLLGNTVGLKWPNDVLVDTPDGHRKICGILAETTTVPGAIVIGAGVNTALAAADLPVPAATSFAALGATCDDDALLAGYLRELDRLLRALAAADGDAIASGVRAAAEAVCLTLGREVAASLPDGSTLRGRADSLAADGRLVIVPGSSASPVALSAGDIVHLR